MKLRQFIHPLDPSFSTPKAARKLLHLFAIALVMRVYAFAFSYLNSTLSDEISRRRGYMNAAISDAQRFFVSRQTLLTTLGLNDLDAPQRDYLQTIGRSSSVLLQLISDVPDVSKIESGQMALETITFSPLDVFEDAVRGYAATATNKGLQVFACVDSTLPAQVQALLKRLDIAVLALTDSSSPDG